MGCCRSSLAKVGEPDQLSKKTEDFRFRIVQMLKLKQLEISQSHKKVTFSKILMKANGLNTTYRRIMDVYKSLDENGDGHLDDDELKQMIERLGVSHEVSVEDMNSIKALCDIDGDHTISIKEFIVTLSLLYLLKAVPSLISKTKAMSPDAVKAKLGGNVESFLLEAHDDGDSAASSPVKDGASLSGGEDDDDDAAAEENRDDGPAFAAAPTATNLEGGKLSPTDKAGNPVFLGFSTDIHYLVHWVVAAYLIFDTTCEGTISRQTLNVMQRENHDDGSDVFLNEDRWRELDWDRNGTVSFEEFIFAFSEWIKDFNDEGIESSPNDNNKDSAE
eukprot:CAMPEP_0118902190 /NCGR_PEP_ID=MMETSP1166-20130328/7586_1 /TAXON_ID=1104430 /ORGANISM="Chrysoreinhardia sp, Strain CCMP3193" /LENGTH=331 /DNA_ID=CAMNT_0006841393 /DNA_START=160 /DNA_END=1155 /DNA_ORIENTATION=-